MPRSRLFNTLPNHTQIRSYRMKDASSLAGFGPQIIHRGSELYRNGNALELNSTQSHDGTPRIHAKVQGSHYRPYTVSAVFDEDYEWYSNCSCPYGYNCKHGVAAILAFQNTSEASPLDTWLQNLSHGEKQGHTAQREKLHYQIATTAQGEYCVRFCKLKHDPKLGQERFYRVRPQELHEYSAHSDTPLESYFQFSDDYDYMDGDAFFNLPSGMTNLFIKSAVQSGRAHHIDNTTALEWEEDALPLSFQWCEQGKGMHYKAVDQEGLPFEQWLPGLPPLFIGPNNIGELSTDLTVFDQQQLKKAPQIKASEVRRVNAHIAAFGLNAMDSGSDANDLVSDTSLLIRATLMGVQTRDGLLPGLKLHACYRPLEVAIESAIKATPKGTSIIEDDGQFYRVDRALESEQLAQKSLHQLSLSTYNYGKEQGEFWIPKEIAPAKHILEWHRILPRLQTLAEEHNWHIVIDESYQTRRSESQFEASLSDADSGWFELTADVVVKGVNLGMHDIMREWLSAGQPDHLPLKQENGQWTLTDMRPLLPVASILEEMYRSGPDSRQKLPNFKAMDFDDDVIDTRNAPSIRKLKADIKNFSGLKPYPPSKKLKATLRDYQQSGLNWLNFLHRHQLGGILADDMGLGKTLQTLAFIQKLKSGRKLSNGALIVAPTSVLWNWASECERFSPNLKYTVFHGPQRHEEKDHLFEHDLILTSYALVQRDAALYESHSFTLLVLDEAQNIKNAKAKTSRACKQIQAQTRLALTGTPLENHLGELWSIMDFALPGLLHTEEEFRRNYRSPIENQQDSEVNRMLAKKVAPFMLRRTKDLVAKELPQKTEIVRTLHLDTEQRNLYEGIRISMEKRIRKLIKEKGAQKSHIEFLDALLKLRQACIDPALVKLKQAQKIHKSCKMEWLAENLPEMIQEGRKILVFSQFTQVLDIIELHLRKAQIKYTKLTGRTRKRQEAIEQFQQGDAKVFLISLKAGGAGLNLTAADTVIHMDPWWNPAVENQATDRAYRIGQHKPVFVYKLVAADTVEEKIQSMQKEKQALADQLFSETKKAKLPSSSEQLLELLN